MAQVTERLLSKHKVPSSKRSGRKGRREKCMKGRKIASVSRSPVAHTCNLSYLGGRGLEKPALGK
jgi:hypothetical protein